MLQLFMIPTNQIIDKLRACLKNKDQVSLVILFGSFADGKADVNSDLDIAVYTEDALTCDEKMSMISDLAIATGRTIDLIDLSTAGVSILRQVMIKGKVIINKKSHIYADFMKKMIFLSEDFLPLRNRILGERRHAWLKE